MREAGAVVRRGPVSESEFAGLLERALRAAAPPFPVAPAGVFVPPPRRFSDEARAEIAARATKAACECPRQVAERVGRLAGFEACSGECLSRSAAGAALHADPNHTAACARALFEAVLERAARAEGIELPT